jgi:hypothetical protein
MYNRYNIKQLYKMKKSIIILAIFMALFSTQSCKKNSNGACDNPICTEEFRGYNLKVLNSTGGAYVFDEMQILDSITNKTIRTTSYNPTNSSNNYLVLDDSNMKDLLTLNDSVKITVLVEKGGDVKGIARFIFKKDCCHISKLGGVETITIQ